MNETKKQIEEMAKLCCWFENRKCTANPGIDDVCDMSCEYGQACEKLMSEGYRKIPEGSVVLTKEEYEKIKSLYDCGNCYMTSSIGDLPLTVEGLRKAVDEITRLNRVEAELQELNAKYYNEAKDLRRELKQARKETAKEFTEKMKTINFDIDFTFKQSSFEDVKKVINLMFKYLMDYIDELAKQYGVEE